jgi:hypothetical protein
MTTKVYVHGTTRTYSDRPTAAWVSVALAASPSWPHVQTTDDLGRVTHIRPPASIATDAQGRWSVELVHAEGVQYLITCDGVTRLLDLGAVDTSGDDPLYPEGAQVEWAALPSDFVTPPPPLVALDALVGEAVADYLTAHPPTGVTDHGALTGLGDDDHTQYALADGTRGSFAAPLGADDNYVTDAEKVKLSNLSGANTGDQTLPTWTTISGKPAVVAAGATQAAARTAIGAGTSSLVVGTGAGDAKAGNYQPTAANVSDSTTTGRALLTAADAAAARTALGLGTAATTAATAYATAAQGTLADSALAASAAPELIRDTMATALVAGSNVTITPNDGADTITIAASGGGGGVVPPEPFIIPPGVGQYLPVLAYGGHYIFPCTGGRSYPCPQYAHEAMNVDAVGAKVDTGVGGATIELALYTWGGGITSTLVSTLGSVDASSAGLKVLTFTPLSLAAGLHLIVARPSTNVSVWGVSGGTMVQDGPPDAGSVRFRFPHHAAASLPSSITWDYGAGVYGNNFPKFQMRRSA